MPRTMGAAIAIALVGALAHAQNPKTESAPPGAKKTAPGGAKPGEAAAGAMPLPRPPAELAQLKLFLGNCKCEGKAPASPMGPEHATHSAVSAKMDLDSFWMMFHIEEKKTKD